MLQDFSEAKPGVIVGPFMGNAPLWSLSYEWAFYLLFYPIFCWIPRRHQLMFVSTLSTLGWVTYRLEPNHFSIILFYLIIWWVGLELARTWQEDAEFSWVRCWIVILPLIWATVLSFLGLFTSESRGYGIYPWLTVRHFCAGLIAVIATLLWSNLGFRGYRYSVGLFSVVAPWSYGLYVFHYPILVDWGLQSGSAVIFFGLAVPTLVIMSWAVEVKFQPVIRVMTDRLVSSFKKRSLSRVPTEAMSGSHSHASRRQRASHARR